MIGEELNTFIVEDIKYVIYIETNYYLKEICGIISGNNIKYVFCRQSLVEQKRAQKTIVDLIKIESKKIYNSFLFMDKIKIHKSNAVDVIKSTISIDLEDFVKLEKDYYTMAELYNIVYHSYNEVRNNNLLLNKLYNRIILYNIGGCI